MTVILRPHHLLCFLTYIGKGYDAAFVANYDTIARRIEQGEDIRITYGPDDICAPMLSGFSGEGPPPHCLDDSVSVRDRAAQHDISAVFGLVLNEGQNVTIDRNLVVRMRAAFAAGKTRTACTGCEWHGLCTRVAEQDFTAVRIHPPQYPPCIVNE